MNDKSVSYGLLIESFAKPFFCSISIQGEFNNSTIYSQIIFLTLL